jgi:tRNA(His) 5'-end guanylyltransferase
MYKALYSIPAKNKNRTFNAILMLIKKRISTEWTKLRNSDCLDENLVSATYWQVVTLDQLLDLSVP